MEDLRYPIGKFQSKWNFDAADVQEFIARLSAAPARYESELSTLSDEQLDTPYREGGWTLRQVTHHVADSHMNAYIRMKWALTEENPTIKAYEEKEWATTPETSAPVALSLHLLKALHEKMVVLAKGLTPQQLERTFTHPETQRQVRLNQLLGMYAWHSDHHLAHITSLKKRMNWK
ncbi:MAG: YfiT family bacillithiol transferase [Flammeovirgaceae bacterium]